MLRLSVGVTNLSSVGCANTCIYGHIKARAIKRLRKGLTIKQRQPTKRKIHMRSSRGFFSKRSIILFGECLPGKLLCGRLIDEVSLNLPLNLA